MVKNLPATQETWDRSLGQEDPLEKGITIHSSIAGRIPWKRSLAGSSPRSRKEADGTERLTLSLPILVHTFFSNFSKVGVILFPPDDLQSSWKTQEDWIVLLFQNPRKYWKGSGSKMSDSAKNVCRDKSGSIPFPPMSPVSNNSSSKLRSALIFPIFFKGT